MSEKQQTATDGELIDFEAKIHEALEAANDPESHVERDADTFHPSQLAFCERQAYTSKLGLKDDTEILGIFQTGTLIHEFLESSFAPQHEHEPVDFEWPIESTDLPTGIKIVGHADCVDRRNGIVYDFKTRNGWYNFDPPVQRHLDQMYLYMAGVKGVDKGQVVYVSKGDMEVRTWPEEGTFEFDDERYREIMDKAARIRDEIEANGIAESADEIPFEKCGCFICNNETLHIPETAEKEGSRE